MTRPGRRPQQVQPEKPAPAGGTPAERGAPAGGVPAGAPPAPPSRIPLGWRVALFLWATSFFFLMVYEILAALIKRASRH